MLNLFRSIGEVVIKFNQATIRPKPIFETVWQHRKIAASQESKESNPVALQSKEIQLAQRILNTQEDIAVMFHGTSEMDSLITQSEKSPCGFLEKKQCKRGAQEAGLYVGGDADFIANYTGADKIAIIASKTLKFDKQRGTCFIPAGEDIVLLKVLAVKNFKARQNFVKPSILTLSKTIFTEMRQNLKK